jgi:pyridoxal phosphate enzyme (YggS family)
MAVNEEAFRNLRDHIGDVTLVAVSKFKSIEDIKILYDSGHRDFGENFVQELLIKKEALPDDIRWHFIGHLQTNKVKYIAPFIYLIQGVDSKRLLVEVNRQGLKEKRKINCLLQVHISEEKTKFGFNEAEIMDINPGDFEDVNIKGLMGIATFTDDTLKIRSEFNSLNNIFTRLQNQHPLFSILSMGMSADYMIACEKGSNMIRVGSIIFGNR